MSRFGSNASLTGLRRQAAVLHAAQALEERAERIQTWPINDGLIAIIGFIVAGVASGVVVRFVASVAKSPSRILPTHPKGR